MQEKADQANEADEPAAASSTDAPCVADEDEALSMAAAMHSSVVVDPSSPWRKFWSHAEAKYWYANLHTREWYWAYDKSTISWDNWERWYERVPWAETGVAYMWNRVTKEWYYVK